MEPTFEITKIEQTLTDGSKVYDVQIFQHGREQEFEFTCYDERAADNLINHLESALGNYTDERVAVRPMRCTKA